MSDRPIGEREFTEGSVRPVFEDDRGQYVIGDDGERVYGVWLLPADEPVSILAGPTPSPSPPAAP